MKNLIIILTVLLSSCATHKRYVSSKFGANTPVVMTANDNDIHIKINMNVIKLPKIINKPITTKLSVLTGYGTVVPLDTFIHPYSYLIRVGGRVVKNDTSLTNIKYIIVYEGSFMRDLSYYVNKQIFFECKSVNINRYMPSEVTEVVHGCIEN